MSSPCHEIAGLFAEATRDYGDGERVAAVLKTVPRDCAYYPLSEMVRGIVLMSAPIMDSEEALEVFDEQMQGPMRLAAAIWSSHQYDVIYPATHARAFVPVLEQYADESAVAAFMLSRYRQVEAEEKAEEQREPEPVWAEPTESEEVVTEESLRLLRHSTMLRPFPANLFSRAHYDQELDPALRRQFVEAAFSMITRVEGDVYVYPTTMEAFYDQAWAELIVDTRVDSNQWERLTERHRYPTCCWECRGE